MGTISSRTAYDNGAIPNILDIRNIEEVTPELLDTYDGRSAYFLFLISHQDLPPLQKLYGLRPPENLDVNSVKKHIKRLLKKVHPDKVPPEERLQSTQICQIMEQGYNNYQQLLDPYSFRKFEFANISFLKIDWPAIARNQKQIQLMAKVLEDNKSFLTKTLQEQLQPLLEQKIEYIYKTRCMLLSINVGILGGGVLGALITATTSIAWPIFLSLLGGAVAGYWKSTRHIAQIETDAMRDREQLLQKFADFASDTNITTFVKDLPFLEKLTHLELSFNESRCNQVRDCYPSQAQDQIVSAIKLSMIFFVSFLPRKDLPTDACISTLQKIRPFIHEQLKDIERILSGVCLLGKRDEQNALVQFRGVPQTSSSYTITNEIIQALSDKKMLSSPT